MMAVGAKYKCTVGDVCTSHTEEVRSLIGELVAAARKVLTSCLMASFVHNR
jgi:hypothetical protein